MAPPLTTLVPCMLMLLLHMAGPGHASNYLMMPFPASGSHIVYFYRIGETLAQRGHKVSTTHSANYPHSDKAYA